MARPPRGREVLALAQQQLFICRGAKRKKAHIRLDIAIQGYPNLGDAVKTGQHP